MSNLNNLNPKAVQGLLSIAAKKLNTSPETLERQLKDGTFEKALSSMPSGDAKMLQQALSNPKTAEKILSTPQAKAIYEKLSKS